MFLGWSDDRRLSTILPAKEARAIKRHLGYETAEELLQHYPRTFAQHRSTHRMDSLNEGDIVTCIGQITHIAQRDTGSTFIVTVTIFDGDHYIDAAFFRARWLLKVLRVGVFGMFTGKLKYFQGKPQLQHPDYLLFPHEPSSQAAGRGCGAQSPVPGGASMDSEQDYDFAALVSSMDQIPIYPAKKSLPTWRIMAAIAQVLASTPKVADPLGRFAPSDLPSFDETLRGLHNRSIDPLSPYLTRLVYDEALALSLVMAVRRTEATARVATALPRCEQGAQQALIESLPYELTCGQRRVMKEITVDLDRTHPMQRLLQGEVGSGKTVVSLVAMLQAVDNHQQCALLAPTEVLAHQHGVSLRSLLDAAGLQSVTVTVLTGSMGVKEKRDALLKIVSGDADIVVGTHSLIQDSVEFFDLGLCVIDEQHRFGVEQRDVLRTKGREGKTPHVLVMTATPIPRTVAITHFGDLSQSLLTELPGGRKPIQCFCVPAEFPRWVQRMWEVCVEQIALGHQVYVVYPRIESESGVEEMFEVLRTSVFQGHKVAMLHGKMAPEDKDAVMEDFASGATSVLVATTVIEVGIDVPNATVMVVMEAERFGASQLHQLRGRVGRGGNESFCFFCTEAQQGTPSFARVALLAETTDGFDVAALDLEMRREGDVLGKNQSGRERTVRFLDLLEHAPLIERANEDAQVIVAEDLELAKRLIRRYDDRSQDYLEKS
ncbi:ATP-dependent DNA helicase RecG [Corynebacterium felinum]|uniref:ATP-dependent DNA helicase RecG n=1 Tax=Corynebacterium felinum TaxID=131318 RepID=A0ABU2B9Z2_9CORY|nr:ATP-dependent DNA helicase RecG [Corynebacterium felinum]MDF5820427.1 ATP-dependent DNA helicase RecG [Corynebacterium felinum]MDR7355464.1 ATP-dependent DNA helicase RecG [Corynebacterium felinum]WJY94815.1 ATP-dependent DNA helicase RecG [Corynebacterium felinum]